MRAAWCSIAVAGVLAVLAVPAPAQQSVVLVAAAAPAKPDANAELSALVGARAGELSAVGVQKIAARTGKGKRDIQLTTRYGAIYFGWPKGVEPVAMEVELGGGGTVVRASGYTDEAKPRYAAALDALIPQAIRRASDAKRYAERPRS